MRVGINLFEFVPPGSRGAGVLNYMKGLIQGLARLDTDDEFWLFVNPLATDVFDPKHPRFHEVVVPLDARKRWTRVIWEQLGLPLRSTALDLDVVQCPSSTASIPILDKCLVTVHATNMFYYREHYPRQRFGLAQAYLHAMQRWVVPRCSKILTVSHHSKREIARHLGVAASRIHVVHHAPVAHHVTTPAPPPSEQEPYILDVSSGAVHKNLPGLIRAYARVRELMDDAPKLVVVGWIPRVPTWGMNSVQELEACSREYGVAEHVSIRTFVDDAELDALYRGAELFAFPSRYEGFGHVVLEAMRRGLPTVVSDRASIPEVAGDATVYVDPDDDESIAQGIVEVLTRPARREQLVHAGFERVRSFGDWSRVAEETLGVMRLVAQHCR
jgi:glycosyltransferase involved in cell wall biosynthesis